MRAGPHVSEVGGEGHEVLEGESRSGGQRFGRVTGRQPDGSGPAGNFGTYFVTDDERGETLTFSYADIVTEGFRTIRTGERVRFLRDEADLGRAVYIIRLDLPDVEAYY
jgi:cold shock CspA family protein